MMPYRKTIRLCFHLNSFDCRQSADEFPAEPDDYAQAALLA